LIFNKKAGKIMKNFLQEKATFDVFRIKSFSEEK